MEIKIMKPSHYTSTIDKTGHFLVVVVDGLIWNLTFTYRKFENGNNIIN